MSISAVRRPASGRYEGRLARSPGTPPARTAPSPHLRTRVGNVPNPLNPAEKIAVSINRRVDLLEEELAGRRISEAAYRVGRDIQDAFENSIRSSSNWNDAGTSVDVSSAVDNQIVRGLENAQHANALNARIVKAVGEVGAERLRLHLGEGKTYRQVAGGDVGERQVTEVAKLFRWLLEAVADNWAARGSRNAPMVSTQERRHVSTFAHQPAA